MDFQHNGSNSPSLANTCYSNNTARRSALNFSRPLPQQLQATEPQGLNINRPRPPVGSPVVSPSHSPGPWSRDPNSPYSMRYANEQAQRPVSRLTVPRTRPGPRPDSMISITPADLPGISHYQPMSYGQLKEIRRVAERSKGDRFPSLPEEQGEFCSEPPDGGFLAWAHAASGFFITFNTLGLNMAFDVFQAYYSKVLLRTSSPSKIAWIGSFQIFANFGLFLLVGLLTSKGYFKLCFRGGAVSLMVTILLTGFCKEWWQFFLVQGVLMGCSMGLVFTSAVTVTTTYFSTNLGIATALAAVGSSFGGVIHPLIFNYSIHKVGFGWTLRIILLVNIITMIFPLIIIRERPGVARSYSSTMDWTMFKDVSYLLMAAGMFFSFWGVYFGFYFISLFGQDVLNMTSQMSLNLLIAMNTCNMLGRLIPGIISDACLGPLNTVIPFVFVSATFIFSWIGVDSVTSIYLTGCFYGFAAAAIQSLYLPTVFSFMGSSRNNSPSRVGLVFILIALATLTGAPIGGRLVTLGKGSYLYAQLFAGISLTLATALFIAARYVKHGWKSDKL
ncbi:hypothetical protein H109_06755 [Trichophyton interdigitale MR816]|uniref:Major facilitator superfamily (MFS) profile domain-containing protein n=1 Tax=Trichophyton interdigitale (strain MR816) TaxID=1215338 RepID=A0A059J0L1_TRIIM|nr:hypothetical protein H109_06755 [Trichophyton interdigitale MR816]